MDHVNNDGTVERKLLKGASYWHYVSEHVDTGRYQVLCYNCNLLKELERRDALREEQERMILEWRDARKEDAKEKLRTRILARETRKTQAAIFKEAEQEVSKEMKIKRRIQKEFEKMQGCGNFPGARIVGNTIQTFDGQVVREFV